MVTITLLPYICQLIFTIVLYGLLTNSSIIFGLDKHEGIQKYHVNPTTRMGGLGVVLSIAFGILLIKKYYPYEAYLSFFMMISFLPVFIGGLLEDLTHKVSAKNRLLLAIISSIMIVYVTQLSITRTDIYVIDYFIQIPSISLIITIFLIVGFVNSINIIDGFHGLASGTIFIILSSFTILALILDDYLIFRILLILITANIGFFFWNWPKGKIFLGDAGSYLFGIWIIVLGIMLQNRSQNISPLAPLLICIYPIIETLFTIYRRKFLKNFPVSYPDAMHLHSLIYRRLIPKDATDKSSLNKANSKVAIYIWIFTLINSLIAIIFRNYTLLLLVAIILAFVVYIIFYASIVKFRTPKYLIIRN
jgi:UDP-N-acetylmuramyl pentapeptide phosphotransferase/UDP-N-acetylglucosamine-1-phosphate transferase